MDIVPNKRKWTEWEKLRGQLSNARRAGNKADLTIEEWNEALEYFGHACAYCGGQYQVIEHYIPIVRRGGTTASNCVPACATCNAGKDAKGNDGQRIHIYNNQRVIDFLSSRGAVISIHVHEYTYERMQSDVMKILCSCGHWVGIYGNEKTAQDFIEGRKGMYGIVTSEF